MRRLACAGLLALACGGEPAADRSDGPAVVEVVTVERRPIDHTLEAVGLVEAREAVWVSSGISGIVRSVHFEEGQDLRFAPGRSPVLFQLDTTILGIEVEGARRRAATVGAELQEAQARFDRAKVLFEGRAASRAEFDEARFALERIKAERSRAQSGVAAEQSRAGQGAVRAPFPGLVGERTVSPGQYVQPGQRLVEILDIDAVVVAFAVPAHYLPRLRLGMPVAVTIPALGDRTPRTSEVSYLAPRVDETGTIHLHAELANPDRALRPGLPARVELVLAAAVDSVVVPEEAIEHRGERAFVYLVAGDRARLREIRIDRRLRGKVVVASGLEGSETIVSRGLERVTDGSPVRPQRAAAAPTAPGPAHAPR